VEEILKRLSAGLLALAVVGGVDGFLTMSLASTQPTLVVSTQPKPAMEMATAQTAIETVVVYGTRPANYASLVAHRVHRASVGPKYAALRGGGLKIAIK